MEKKITENGNKLIVSEFVSYGHPDKIADQIADAIVDAFVSQDENARTGIEVMVKDNIVVLGGEVNSSATVDYDSIVRQVYEFIDFPESHNLKPGDIKVLNLIGKQSPEIHSGVDKEDEIGAGDQGFMVGYACDETSVYMPLGHYMARTICNYVAQRLAIGPDAKSQVIVEYGKDGNAVGIHSILVSAMHKCNLYYVRGFVKDAIDRNYVGLDKGIYEKFIKDKDVKIDVNPCGSWQIGGPISDCGVTGRKLVVDSYGGYCNIGGGNYSGKDFSKVDRSGAYMARYLAKNIVAGGFCGKCRVTLSYMIGVAQPCSLEIDVDRNAERLPELKRWIYENVDLTPKGIYERLGKGVSLLECSRYGHFGFDGGSYAPCKRKWEETDIAEDIRQFA